MRIESLASDSPFRPTANVNPSACATPIFRGNASDNCEVPERRPLVSIVVPVCNEVSTLNELINRVEQLDCHKEVLIVDDGSTDGTTEVVQRLGKRPNVHALFHLRNLGKGAAIRTALPYATGDIIVIQDADLEYDPGEIDQLIQPILQGRADVVYGSRFAGNRSKCSFPRRAANQFLTSLSNRFTGLPLTDMETCYKVMRREVATSVVLREDRFGIEPELTAKIARGKWRIAEAPISYAPRSYAAGKKIGFRDGLRAVWCILRYSRWD